MESVNTAFMKAGTMGLSVLFASGDQGVCGREGCGEGTRKRFKPDFPGGSPYQTSVGGTDFYGTTIGEETAWRSGGGGFSDTFPIPAYQKDAVASYKKDLAAAGLLPDASLYNDTGRGYPDVAALGGTKDPYCINIGRWAGVAGTSAACPVVSAIFARLNSILLAKGNPPLGFLNPFIYAHPEAFQDVTHGINSDTQTAGFTAIKGWDAATGWGTPNFEALKKIVDVM
jgi:tripeptidyl-peptidase-1